MSSIPDAEIRYEQTRRLPALIERVVSLPVLPGDRPDQIRTKRLFTAAIWGSLVTSAISVYQFYLFDAPWAAAAVGLPILAAGLTLVAMWLRPSTFPAVMHLIAFGSMSATALVIVMFGGVFETAGNTLWSVLAVVGAVAIFADRRAHAWLAVFAISVVGSFFVSQQREPLYILPNREYFAVFNLLTVGLFIYVVLYHFVTRSARLYRQSESLILNILPEAVADRLRTSGEMIADEYDSASILFADIADFTPLTAALEPNEVVNLLNEVFTAFDRLVEARNLEKIKTIGDSYMVAAGVPVKRDDHARAICDLALDIKEQLATGRFGGRRIEMRIGIASGPVMGGIIGQQKFSYDLWGDTVNLASRMESTGSVGRIQLPSATRELVAEWFVFEERGIVEVKGRGPIETCFLLDRVRA